MANYNKFFSESQRFVAALESAAPMVALRQPEHVQAVHHGIRSHHSRIMNATSPAVLVVKLRGLCSDVSKWNIPELEPAINRYENILDNIDLDNVEGNEFDSGMSLLRNSFVAAADRIEVMLVAVVKTKGVRRDSKLVIPEGLTRGSMRSITGIATTTSTRSDAGADAKPPEPTLRVRLTGDKVKGITTVERGASCVLTVDWGLLDDTTIVELMGNELQRAREAQLEVVFVLYSGLFKVESNRTRIATRFKDDGFETPVQFGLTAPDNLTGPGNPAVKSKLHLEIEIHGRPAVRIPIVLTVVHDLSAALADAPATPVKVDLDKLIAGAGRQAPAAVLRIDSTGVVPSAELMVLKPLQVLVIEHVALKQLSIANQLEKIAAKMDKVAKDPIWNLLSDPLKSTATEMLGLLEPLARAASAGSELHEWLAMSAGIKEILDRIDVLPIGSTIIVRSDGVAIPWETIYSERYRFHESDGAPPAAVDIAKFWGYRFEFETILSPGKYDLPEGDTDRIEQHRNGGRKLTAVLNKDIDSEMQWKAGPPVKYQRETFMKACGGALTAMQLKSECADVRKLLDTEPTSGSFVYFYCHGRAERPFDPEAAVLKINEECRIEVSDVSYDATFSDAPIVFLNSCSSGPLASVSFDSFCARFSHKGAIGLITTSFAVPAPFAARFGCDLILRYMKAEETLGEILLDMRRKALDARIPIGLFYMLRGPREVRLKAN